MCRSIESAILGVIHSVIYLLIITKYSNYETYNKFIPFILNIGLVQLGNLVLWFQHSERSLIKNKINHVVTILILLILYTQPLTIYYMTSDMMKSQPNLKNITLIISIIFLIYGFRDIINNKDEMYSIIKDNKTLMWGKNERNRRFSKYGKYLYLICDLIPLVVAYISTNDVRNLEFIKGFSFIALFTFLLVIKYSVWWGSEWCAYGNILSGYIVYYLLGKN